MVMSLYVAIGVLLAILIGIFLFRNSDRVFYGKNGTNLPVFAQVSNALTYVDENNRVINHKFKERTEQCLVFDYLPRDARVLELGARYGTVSCLTNRLLQNPQEHVVVEPDPTVLPALKYNRTLNDGKFQIVEGIVSKRNFMFDPHYQGYATSLQEVVEPSMEGIPTFTLKEVEEKYNTTFNVLIVDIEGGFQAFLEDFIHDMDAIQVIFLEKDASRRCDYARVDQLLKSRGFKRIRKHTIQEVWVKSKT